MSIGADWRQISPGAGNGTGTAKTAGANATSASLNGAAKIANGQSDKTAAKDDSGESFSQFLFGKDGFDFGDLIDIINPLQHIPIVGAIYREMTGDEMGNAARVVGGGLFGGVFGLVGAAADAVVDATTGEDTGSHVLALFEGGDQSPDTAGTAVADASDAKAAHSTDAASAANVTASNAQNLVLPWDTANAANSASSNSVAAVDSKTVAENTASTAQGATGVSAQDMVYPWSANDRSMANVMAANASAPDAGFDVRNAQNQSLMAQADTPPTNDIPQSAMTAAQATSANATQAASAQAGMAGASKFPAPQNSASAVLKNGQANLATSSPVSEGQQADPAELAVTLARAGRSDMASQLAAKQGTSATQASLADGPNVIKRSKGTTVWQRARKDGRFDRLAGVNREINAEVIAAKSQDRQRDFNSITGTAKKSDTAQNGEQTAPLSPAEMAARFNQALGLGNSPMTASVDQNSLGQSNIAGQNRQNTASSSNRAPDRNVTAQRETAEANTPDASGQDSSALANHPLVREAENHHAGQAPVGAWFSQTMMQGLQKYADMQRQQKTANGNAI
jgi:hypothetical protein